MFDEIQSIDEAKRNYMQSFINISPEIEFWAHCSNLQAWVENEYDATLLHSNIAFPLLKKLGEVGDLKAKKIFKEQIAKRFISGFFPTMLYLLKEGYLEYLCGEEVQTIIYNSEYPIPR